MTGIIALLAGLLLGAAVGFVFERLPLGTAVQGVAGADRGVGQTQRRR